MSASTASASLPRPSHDNACARTKFGSAPAPAWIAASASRSARARSASQTAPYAALTSRSASGARSESRLNVARRTTIRMSSRSLDAASSLATSPRSRRSRVRAARFRRTCPYNGCATRTSMPPPAGSSVMRPRASASSTAAASVIRVKVARSSGSPTASTSIALQHAGERPTLAIGVLPTLDRRFSDGGGRGVRIVRHRAARQRQDSATCAAPELRFPVTPPSTSR